MIRLHFLTTAMGAKGRCLRRQYCGLIGRVKLYPENALARV